MRIFENLDCMEGMDKYKDILTNRKTLAIVDPPYGINAGKVGKYCTKNKKEYQPKDWDSKIPDDKYFNFLSKYCDNFIIWGGNYYANKLKNSRGWIFWDKVKYIDNYADGELAYTSFDKNIKQITLQHHGFLVSDSETIHPTQKPIKLYKWLLENYAKDHDLILDTHVGSASSLIACEEYGIDYIGFELDKDYYKAAKERLEKARFIRENKKAETCYVNDLALFQK